MRMSWIATLAAVMVLVAGAQAWADEVDVDDVGGTCGTGKKTLCYSVTTERCLKWVVVETSGSIDGKGGSAGYRLDCQEKLTDTRHDYYP